MHCKTFTCIMQVKKLCCYAFKEYWTYESTINRYCWMITMLFQSVLIVIPYQISYSYLPGTPQLSVYIFIWCKVLNSLDRVKLAISTTLTIRRREIILYWFKTGMSLNTVLHADTASEVSKTIPYQFSFCFDNSIFLV